MISRCDIPEGSLLEPFEQQGYADCYTTHVPRPVDLETYIAAFYNSCGFRPERILLSVVAGRYADNQSALDLASDRSRRFSAWEVTGRSNDEILLEDMTGATRSWLKVTESVDGTQLYFGSAVVRQSGQGQATLFSVLTPFHKLYSRVLLATAVSSL